MTINIPDENVGEDLSNLESIMDILYEYSHIMKYDVICESSVLGVYMTQLRRYYDANLKTTAKKNQPRYSESF